MNTFKWGIIGPGQIAKEFAEDLQHTQYGHHHIQAVLGHTIEKAKAFAEEQQVPQFFDNLELLLQQSDINAVYIATPHPLHCEQTLQCLAHKIPVLCEKPLAMNYRQVKEMTEAAEQHHTFLMEGMWIHFLPGIRKLLSLIEAGTIGQVLCVNADISFRAPQSPDNRYFDPDKGGGSLLDLGIYAVYLAHLLLGKPDAIHACAKLSDTHVDESCAALFRYRNGAYATIESSLIIETEQEAVIYGDKGKIKILPPWFEVPKVITVELYDGATTTHHCGWEGRGLQFEIDEVYSCLQKRKIESEHFCHHFSLDLAETMDEIRKQTGIRYPKDIETT